MIRLPHTVGRSETTQVEEEILAAAGLDPIDP